MTGYNKILHTNPEKGISIVCDGAGNMAAFVGGKFYDIRGYRPIDGNGRQLRQDSIDCIKSMLERAKVERDVMREAEEKRIADMVAAKAVTPVKSFADALQDSFLNTLTQTASGEMVNMIYPVVEKMLVDKFGLLPVVHEVRIPDRKPFETTEILHEKFTEILNTLMVGEAVYLCGPAGTGKSYIAQQLAKALEVSYYYANNVVDDVTLKGFIDANGRYHETEFYKAFKFGGVFLLDEMDASNEEVLTLLNNALANGVFPFPHEQVKAHEHFYCVSAGNTFGTGGDNIYTGRRQLDGATLDRFAFFTVNYDGRIELAMASGDKSLVEFAQDFRKATAKTGINCLCTYRAIKRLAKFSAFMSKADALHAGLIKGLAADDVELIKRQMSVKNEWFSALENLVNSLKHDGLPF